MSLAIDEIRYCYSLNRSKEKWYLKARTNSSSLVEVLASSHNGIYKDIIVITDNKEFDP